MSTAWRVRANTEWLITACKATQVDACRLLLTNYSLGHRCVSRPTELSAVALSRLCCGRIKWGWRMVGRGPHLLCQADKSTDIWAARQQTALQLAFCSSDRSPLGPWENRRDKLHLFSVCVPWGIKGEDISSHPAWLGLTHLRAPFLPHSLWAFFTHLGDMARGTVAA